jgi:hypothetical protein
MAEMSSIISSGTENTKYVMYSAHDTQIGIIWEFLGRYLDIPEWYYIPYASYMTMSLYSNNTGIGN